jgi:arylsulfatase A-like enzyme
LSVCDPYSSLPRCCGLAAGPLRGYKRSVYEGGIRAPLIVRWPGQVPANTTTDTIVSFTDMLPTMADIAGLDTSALPAGTEGTSFKSALLNPTQQQRPPVYWEFCQQQGRFAYGNGWAQAVRMDDLKLIR